MDTKGDEGVCVCTQVGQEETHLPLITQGVSSHLSGHALLVEGPQFALIVHLNELLAAGGRKRDIELQERLNKEPSVGCTSQKIQCFCWFGSRLEPAALTPEHTQISQEQTMHCIGHYKM